VPQPVGRGDGGQQVAAGGAKQRLCLPRCDIGPGKGTVENVGNGSIDPFEQAIDRELGIT